MTEQAVTARRVFLIGTIVWLVVLVGLLPFWGTLADHGQVWWIWSCVAGVGIGLIGWEIARRGSFGPTEPRHPASRS